MTIRQSDITNNSVSFSRFGTISFTTSVVEMENNVSITAYALGLSTGMTATQPLFIKENGTGATGWVDQQDWTLYGIAITTTIPWADLSSGTFVPTTASASLTTGDLIGIFGPGAWSGMGSMLFARIRPAAVGSLKGGLMVGGSSRTSTEFINGGASDGSRLGANLNTAAAFPAGAGTENAALVACGNISAVGANELFNGAVWAITTALSTTKYGVTMGGSQNAAFINGGFVPTGPNGVSTTELYNGSSWSTSGNTNVSGFLPAGFGVQNAGVVAGADIGAGVGINRSELFNGSSWSYSGIIRSAKSNLNGAGSQNAGIIAGGFTNSNTDETDLFNGSTWFASGVYPFPTNNSGIAGSQNGTLGAGGSQSGGAVDYIYAHNQSTYGKITSRNIKDAKNIGVVTAISGSAANIKFNGYVTNMRVTSSNSAITTAAQWIGTYLVLNRYSPNGSSTNNPASIMSKTQVEADDLVVGYSYSQTQSYIFGNNIYGLNNQIIW
jgi:hypothetical protein